MRYNRIILSGSKRNFLVNSLRKKSVISYIIISILVLVYGITITLLTQNQENSGETIRIAGKQGVITERIALLSNNYFYASQKTTIKIKIYTLLKELEKNHNYIIDLKNPTADHILYNIGYQYDNILKQYQSNITKFIENPTHQLLKIINYTNESLLITADTLTTLLANEKDNQNKNLIIIIIVTTVFFILFLFLIYKKVTLASIIKTLKTLEELEEQKTFMSTILENSAHAIIATDLNGVITLFNKKAEEILGYTADEMIHKNTPASFHKKEEIIERAKILSHEFGINIDPGFQVFVEKTNRDLPNTEEWTYIKKDGSEIIVKLSVTALKNTDQKIHGYLGMAEDITKSKEEERTIQEYVELVDKNIIISSTDLEGTITYVSEAFCNISGYSKNELIGKNHHIVRHPDVKKSLYEDMWNHLRNNQEWCGEIINLKKDGSSYWVKANISPIYDILGNKVGYTAIRQDITDKKLIEKISITDGLTDIYNRRHFDTIFPQMVQSSKRDKSFISFLIMDVDHFKQYNDTYGHQKGDNALIEIAHTLKTSLKRQDDFCFRLGGEEFGLVFSTDSKDEAFHYANNIKERIENLKIEHTLNSASKYVTVSMGLICLNHNHVKSEDVIYGEADKLLYQAKKQGRNIVITKE